MGHGGLYGDSHPRRFVQYQTRQDKTSDTDHTIDSESLSLRLSDTEVTVFKSKFKNLSS